MLWLLTAAATAWLRLRLCSVVVLLRIWVGASRLRGLLPAFGLFALRLVSSR